MADNAEVCGCNGVCKGTIVKAFSFFGLFSLVVVCVHTKASASCGSCTGLVEQILANTVGDYSAPTKEKALCGCTEYTHEKIRKVIREHHLTSIPAVMQFCEWRTSDGCPKCRPVLFFFLFVVWFCEVVVVFLLCFFLF